MIKKWNNIFMKKGLILFSLMVISVLISGCVKVDTTLKVNSDGSGDLSVIYGVDKQISSFSDISSSFEDAKKELKKQGYKTTNISSDKYIGINIKKHFDNLKDIKSPGGDPSLFNFTVDEKKGFFKTNYSVKGVFDFTGMTGKSSTEEMDRQMEQSMINQMDLNFTLELPVKAGENNASEVKDNDKKLIWDFTPNEKNNVEFEFSKINYLNIALLGIVVVVIVFALFIIRKKKKGTVEQHV